MSFSRLKNICKTGRLINIMNFHGRDSYIKDFKELLVDKRAKLVTCQGRRRIGKSTFIKQCANFTTHFISVSGLPPQPELKRQDQLDNFSATLNQQLATPKILLEDWSTAFHYLSTIIPKTGSTLVLLDEVSWMSKGDPNFAGYLKNAWDDHFKNHPRLIIVLCGSVSSWIDENILNSTGFVGRISWQFKIDPLPLQHCNAFWKDYEKKKKRTIPEIEKLRLLSITGGVPRYLEEVNYAQSAEQNIARMCFHPSSLLFREFDQIFHDIFMRKAPTFRKIVRTLVDGPRMLKEISDSLGRDSGGTLSKALKELVGAGFITEDRSFSPISAKPLQRTARFRLSDNYLRFYLKYVEPKKLQIEKGIYQQSSLTSLEAWHTIIGLQFENLVYNSRHELLSLLGLDSTTILNYSPYFQNATQRKKSCQIDLLIRTKSALYIVESKVREKIDASVIEEVREKIIRLKAPKNLAIRSALVYQGDLEPSLTDSDYFDHLISFKQLLHYK